MMQLLMQIDADFERVLWNIDTEGLCGAIIGRILMIQILMQISSKICGIMIHRGQLVLLLGEYL